MHSKIYAQSECINWRVSKFWHISAHGHWMLFLLKTCCGMYFYHNTHTEIGSRNQITNALMIPCSSFRLINFITDTVSSVVSWPFFRIVFKPSVWGNYFKYYFSYSFKLILIVFVCLVSTIVHYYFHYYCLYIIHLFIYYIISLSNGLVRSYGIVDKCFCIIIYV